MAYPIVEVPTEQAEQLEQLGTKYKFWYGDNSKLFKAGREGTGENWAEKVSGEIAEALGVPHAEYELAVAGDIRGVTTSNFVPLGYRLVHGNELIGHVVAGSEMDAEQIRRQYHTIGRIHALLSQDVVGVPLGWEKPAEIQGPFGVFTGYVLLDALIGNQDRHEENWALLSREGEQWLAPTFDHASSLGRSDPEERRAKLLSDQQAMIAYVDRAKSLFYGRDQKRLRTHEAFDQCLRLAVKSASFWLMRLQAVSEHDLTKVVERVPESWMSANAKEFALRMLFLNRARLLRER